jgi:hypothetical protein
MYRSYGLSVGPAQFFPLPVHYTYIHCTILHFSLKFDFVRWPKQYTVISNQSITFVNVSAYYTCIYMYIYSTIGTFIDWVLTFYVIVYYNTQCIVPMIVDYT